jgi:hypothetical protein
MSSATYKAIAVVAVLSVVLTAESHASKSGQSSKQKSPPARYEPKPYPIGPFVLPLPPPFTIVEPPVPPSKLPPIPKR